MEPPSPHSVHVINPEGFDLQEDCIARAVLAALSFRNSQPSDVRVLISTDEHVLVLNTTFRRVYSSTDVLTFPDGESASGDIAISYPCAVRQASHHSLSIQHEVELLAIHGALHLCGLDDVEESDRTEMVKCMCGVAAQIGLPPMTDWSSLPHPDCADETLALSRP